MEASRQLFDKFSDDESQQEAVAAYPTRRKDVLSRSWLAPEREHEEIVGIDFGRGLMWGHCLWSGKTIGPVPYKAAIQSMIYDTPTNSLIVTESAHVGVARKINSLAQIFTGEELFALYDGLESGGKTLRLFPHSATRRAGRWVALNAPAGFVDEGKTTDLNDAKIIAYYVGNKNDVSLMKPVRSFTIGDKSRYGRAVRRLSDGVLGPARSLGYKIEDIFPLTLRLAHELYVSCKHTVPLLNDSIQIAIGVMSLVIRETPATHAAAVADEPAGLLVFRGRVPGYRFWKRHVLMMSPWHHAAGIFRSNLMHHRYPSVLKARLGIAGNKKPAFSCFNDDQNATRVAVSREMRSDLKTLYGRAVEIASDAGLPHYEVLENTT